jgi:ATP adenylyltransferase
MEYDDTCIFCQYRKKGEGLEGNEFAFAKLDKYPVTEGHTLIIPNRHLKDFFEITKVERNAVFDLIHIRKKQLREKDSSIEGFNIGINSGTVAGQTILHCHIHLIPRRKGDMDDPRGGVRGVIPSKMKYQDKG